MQYFKHQSNMRHDIKIKRVINKYGLEGYGLYNLIVESITESLCTNSPIPDLQEDCEDIAEFYNGNTSKINEMMNYMINQGLFDIDEISGHIFCSKVYKFLDTSQTRSKQLRDMIKAYKGTQLLLSQNVSDISDSSQDKSEESHDKSEESHDKSEEQNITEEKRNRKDLEKGETDKSPIMENVIKNLANKKTVNQKKSNNYTHYDGN